MSKFKEFIKKVTSKFSTPVKTLAAEVLEENNFKIDSEGNVKAKKLQVSWYNSNPSTSEKWSSGVIDGSPSPEQSFVVWNNKGLDEMSISINFKTDNEGLKTRTDQLIVDWKSIENMIEVIDREIKIKQLKNILIKTKSKRIKKKLQKRIDGYGKNTITRN